MSAFLPFEDIINNALFFLILILYSFASLLQMAGILPYADFIVLADMKGKHFVFNDVGKKFLLSLLITLDQSLLIM